MSDGEKGETGLAAKVKVGRERKKVKRRVSSTLLCVKKSLWNMEKRPESMCSVYENMGVGGRRKWGYTKRKILTGRIFTQLQCLHAALFFICFIALSFGPLLNTVKR